jgi:hypothetical protein
MGPARLPALGRQSPARRGRALRVRAFAAPSGRLTAGSAIPIRRGGAGRGARAGARPTALKGRRARLQRCAHRRPPGAEPTAMYPPWPSSPRPCPLPATPIGPTARACWPCSGACACTRSARGAARRPRASASSGAARCCRASACRCCSIQGRRSWSCPPWRAWAWTIPTSTAACPVAASSPASAWERGALHGARLRCGHRRRRAAADGA